MKKLIAMLSAVAMSFGLFADSYNISFEQADEEKGVNVSEMTFTPDGEQQWTGAVQKLGAYAEPYDGYAYGEDALARRTNEFDAKSTNANFLKLETGSSVVTCAAGGNVFLDQVVKFTGFEEAPVLGANDKIAVWASEFPVTDSEDDETTTNLWVSCGKVVDDETTQINLPLNVAGFQLDKWYRLTIKSLGNVYAEGKPVNARAGFIVYIDGVQVGSSEDAAKELTNKAAFLTPAASGLMASGMLFLGYKDDDAAFTTVAYQGIGAIDDLILDNDGPVFAQMANVAAADLAIDGAVLEKVMQGDKEIPLVGGFYTVSPGDIVAYYTAAAGKILKGDPTATWTAAKDGTVVAKGDPAFTVVDAYVQVGGELFEKLATALARVQQLEQTTDDPITVNILKAIEAEDITNVGTFGFSEGATIVIAKGGNWTVTGDALFVAEIGEGKTVEVSGTLTFVGTVKAGAAVTAETMANDVGEIEIVLEPTATVTTKTDLSAVISATEGEIEPIPGEDGWKTYQVKTVPPVSYGFKVILADTTEKGQYETFAEALAAVEEGATIVLLKGVENAPGVVISGKPAFTIDFGGFTWTANKPGAGSSGTEKAAFQILKGQTVVFKNGEMAASEDNLVAAVAPNKNIYRFIQNYGNLTLLDMEFDATNLYIDPNHAADYYPSAIEICYGTVAITGSTSISDKNGMASLTVDTYKTAAYKEGADVTVDTTGSIASILCYSEGTYAQETPSDLVLTAGTIGSLAMAGGEEVTVSKSNDVQLNPPAGYLWNEGVLVAAVAEINGTYFATLPAAFTAVTEGKTITLLKDVTFAPTAMYTIPCSCTLALNGNTLTGNGGKTFEIIDNKTFTVDGTVDGSAVTGARFNVGKGTNAGGVVTEYNGGLVLNGGTYTIGENCIVHVNGYCTASTVTIQDAILTAQDNAIQFCGGGTFEIDGCEITGTTAVYVKSPDTTITDSTLKATGAAAPYVFNSNGANSTGDALVIDTCGYSEAPITITLSGNTIESENNAAIASYAKDENFTRVTGFVDRTAGNKIKNGAGVETAADLIAVDEGYQGKWVEDEDDFLVPDEEIKTFALTLTNNDTATLSSDPVATAPIAYGTSVTVTATPETGYQFVEATDPWVKSEANLVQTFTMTDNVTIEAPIATLIPVVEPVAEIDGKGYPTLQEAFTAAQDGDTVKILKDITDDNVYVIDCGGAITVDFNGKTVKSTSIHYTLSIQNGTAVTITGNGTLQKYDTTQAGTTMVAIDDGSLTLESGTLLARNQASNPVVNVAKGSFTVNGGVVKADPEPQYTVGPAVRMRATAEGSTAVVNAGEITGPFLVDTSKGYTGTITIPATSTAKFDRDQTAFCATGYMTDDSQDGTATPYFVGAKIAITYDYGAGTAPEPANKAAFAAYTAARTFTLTQPTAPSGMVFDAWTTDATGVTFDGDAMTITADFGTAFTVTATYKKDGPVYPPEWPDAPAYAEKFAAWSIAYDLTGVDLTTDAAKNAFLMNVDPKGTVPTLTIDSIEVDNAEETATIVVSAGEKNLDEINGVLYVDVTDELGGEWATRAFDLATEIDKTTGKATFEVSTAEGQFMKAKVGFTTPTVE